MENKHTPGPWAASAHEDTGDIVVRDSQGFIVANLEYDYNEAWNNKMDDSEIQANAKITAAAPIMLEALQAPPTMSLKYGQ